ncbi:MAG TPA: acyl-CoA desaturase [Bacteroidia bacterium]|jgi:linoleoyl-CoA desaturase|nr:acyl-CoA desaturase [Bacteroidia bacterium]
MQAIKFVEEVKGEHQFATVLRKRVNNYFKENNISTKGNFTLAMQTIVTLSLYLIPFILILTVHMNIWVAMAMPVIMGIGIAGVGMCVMHDAVHGSYSHKEWVNKLFGTTLYLLGGNVFNWKMQHNIFHHAFTNIEGIDEDIASRGPLRLSENAPLKKIHHYQYIHAFFFYGLLTISKIFRDFTQLAEYNIEGVTRKYNVNPKLEYFMMVVRKFTYLAIAIGLPILFSPYNWWQVLIGFFIMHWVAGCILSTVFQMAHVVEGADQPMPDKTGIIHHDWAVHELHTTSDFARGNHLLNWYIGGLNFQIEHHLFPQISHVHYRNLAPIVEQTAREFGLAYNLKPTFRNALFSHIKRLKILGVSPPTPQIA